MRYVDRTDAGRRLARLLSHLRGPDTLVLGLPRGGIPVAYEVAKALDAELDLWSVRKLGAPGYPELGMGAVAEGGAVFVDPEIVAEVGATADEVARLVRSKTAEVEARATRFREGRPPPPLTGRTVIVVDDGIATGGTARAAVQALRAGGARHIVLAAPVAATQALETLGALVDEVVCDQSTPALDGIGAWYDDFTQVDDGEVLELLRQARSHRRALTHPDGSAGGTKVTGSRSVVIPVGGRRLEGELTLPRSPVGLVLFAHGSGSSRLSPRNQRVAAALNARGIATLLFDLLTADEEREDDVTAELRFDIELLAKRLVLATRWAREQAATSTLPFGYFGASTGAAAALVAASQMPGAVQAVVSRGGRPDLAAESLAYVEAPTLLIVGGADREVLELNRDAARRLRAPTELAVVPGATHLFEEPGALEEVGRLAADWFVAHFETAQPEAST